jgi:hypothetical protein
MLSIISSNNKRTEKVAYFVRIVHMDNEIMEVAV